MSCSTSNGLLMLPGRKEGKQEAKQGDVFDCLVTGELRAEF